MGHIKETERKTVKGSLTDRDRQREREREIERDRQTHTEIYTKTQRRAETNRQTTITIYFIQPSGKLKLSFDFNLH